jgi:DNA-binding NtrC family response regulator
MGRLRKDSDVPATDAVVVDGDERSRTRMVALLATHDCLVRSFESADAAFAAALRRVPDVVLTGLHFADGEPSGWALAAMLQSDMRMADVGLIAIAGQAEPKREIVRAFDAYVRRPLDAGLVLTLVRELVAFTRAERRAASDARPRPGQHSDEALAHRERWLRGWRRRSPPP